MRHEKVNDLFRPLMNGLAPEAVIDVYQNQVRELELENKHLANDNKRLKIALEEIRLELNKTLIELDEEFKICPGCAGAGDVRQTAKSNDIEETWIKCEECLGEGKVQKWA
uniref:Putative chaperone n=1 Tax=viral metagenome TaxID=1070528 RepID=A0A6M3Y0C3_9ZZZZ